LVVTALSGPPGRPTILYRSGAGVKDGGTQRVGGKWVDLLYTYGTLLIIPLLEGA
jgi:hypothetical protein